MAKRFVSWAAVSSLPQAKRISLSEQQKSNLEHIERHDGQLVAELTIPGESRDIVLFSEACERIGAYASLHKLLDQRALDVLICYSRSRLGRTLALVETVAELCRRAGVLIYETETPPVSLDLDNGYDSLLVGAIKSAGAQQEIRQFIERNRMGMIGRVRSGKFPHMVPYGWSEVYTDSGELRYVINEDEATVVRRIVSLYLEHGWGLKAIAGDLNERGTPSPFDTKWWHQSINRLLERAWVYAGHVELNRHSTTGRKFVRYPATYDAIITEEQAAAVHAERRRRRSARRSVNANYRFSQCIVCSQCGRFLNAETSRQKYERSDGTIAEYRSRRYRCRGGYDKEHDNYSVSESKILDEVSLAIDFVSDSTNHALLLAERDDPSGRIQKAIEELERQAGGIRAQMERADDAYVGGTMDVERYRRQVERLTAQLNAIDTDIAALQDELLAHEYDSRRPERLQEAADHAADMLTEPDIAKANAWFRKHLRIVVHHDLVAVRWI